MDDKKVFRSIIKKYFPMDLLLKLEQITRTYDWNNNEKTNDVKRLLQEYNVPFSSLGNGTNRYGILVDGYAIKIALDRAGKIDNKREFKYTKKLQPYVVKVYECLPTGLLATFEYVTIFSLDDFYDYQSDMREILEILSEQFLIGDIGISSDNYVNWGVRTGGDVVIMDFAYIYALSYRGFSCTCEDEPTLEFDKDYNNLICPLCRRKWSFSDIRKRITRADELKEIGDIRELGYLLRDDMQEMKIDPSKTPVKSKKKKQKKEKEVIEYGCKESDFSYDGFEELISTLDII